MRRFTFALVALAAIATCVPEASADRRVFGWTYPYMTLPEGTLELEHYLDLGLNEWDDPDTPEVENGWGEVYWQQQVEFEYGITDHLDFGFYNVFRQKPYGNFEYRGPKLRTRYRFGEESDYFLDPAIYFETAYFGDEVKLEEMIILGKKLGKIEMALNLKGEQEYKLESEEWEFEFIPTFGVGYHLTHNFSIGLEYYGKAKFEHGEMEYFVNYVGPAISFAGKSFYWTIAGQPQLGSNDDLSAFQIRSLFGATF